MTKVSIIDTGDKIRFKAEGHAGFSDAGSDIVCSAVSVLAFTLCETMDVITSANAHSGLLEFEADVPDELRGAVVMARTGFSRLAEMYPEYVSFIYREVSE